MNEPSVLFRSRKFRVERVDVPLAGGASLVFDRVVHPGAAVILPLLDERRVVMLRNYRHSIGTELLELPAGTLDPPEAPLACALRELEEETGYRAASMTPLVSFYATPGFCTERMHVFVARGLAAGAPRPEAGELLQTEIVTLDAALNLIGGGGIIDAKTIVALLYYARFSVAGE